MKTNLIRTIAAMLLLTGIIIPDKSFSQGEKNIVKKYLQELPKGWPDYAGVPQRYRMTAIYTNMDLYGNFTGRTKVSGDYTCGLEDGMASWTNVTIAGSEDNSGPFPEGTRLDYMNNFKYRPSPDMLKEDAFTGFPATPENILGRNLIWDMSTIEEFAWNYSDSLNLNTNYSVPDIMGEFQMAGIGTYDHSDIQLCWTGISLMNGELCAVIEYRAIDNRIKMTTEQIKTSGTEQYWGTTWISLRSRQIEYAEMYGGTIQEIDIKGFQDKLLVKTIRVLWVERIS